MVANPLGQPRVSKPTDAIAGVALIIATVFELWFQFAPSYVGDYFRLGGRYGGGSIGAYSFLILRSLVALGLAASGILVFRQIRLGRYLWLPILCVLTFTSATSSRLAHSTGDLWVELLFALIAPAIAVACKWWLDDNHKQGSNRASEGSVKT